MSPAIFISFRREDSGWSTQALHAALSSHFGEDQIFMDFDDIYGGDDFAEIIESTLKKCERIGLIKPMLPDSSRYCWLCKAG